MKQPIKNKVILKLNKGKVVKKKKSNKQPIPKNIEFWVNGKYKISKKDEKDMKDKNVTVSKLEYLFMRNFLDKLEIKYIHQWESPSKFIYDFAILGEDKTKIKCLIEVDGDFWHLNPKTNKGKTIYESQKKQQIRDDEKNKWAAMNGIVLLRFWENDINNNPQKILNELKKRLIVNKN